MFGGNAASLVLSQLPGIVFLVVTIIG